MTNELVQDSDSSDFLVSENPLAQKNKTIRQFHVRLYSPCITNFHPFFLQLEIATYNL